MGHIVRLAEQPKEKATANYINMARHCEQLTKVGFPCGNRAMKDKTYCYQHRALCHKKKTKRKRPTNGHEVKQISQFLAKGGSGCVYKPPLTCFEEELNQKYGGNSRYVMKMMTEKSAVTELKFAKILQTIDPTQDYFLYIVPDEICHTITPLAELKTKCDMINEDFRGYVMKDGGDSLSSLESKRPMRITLYAVIKWLRKLLGAILLLQRVHIVHQDVRNDNITIDEEGEARIIDFGIALVWDEIDPSSEEAFYYSKEALSEVMNTSVDIHTYDLIMLAQRFNAIFKKNAALFSATNRKLASELKALLDQMLNNPADTLTVRQAYEEADRLATLIPPVPK